MDSFLYQATLYLAAMVVAVPIASRLGLGSVLGYLVAGLLIGPVFGLVGTEMEELRHVAEFGVVLMLFLIGLDLEPRALWAMRDRLIGLGGAQVALTTLAVMALALLAGEMFTVALAIGLIFSLSSTAIVLQTLSEKNLVTTPGGRAAFSVLLMQDIAVIPMLALLPLLALPGLFNPGADATAEHTTLSVIQSLPAWGVTLATVAAVGLVILIGHLAIRPIFRFAHGARLREVNTAVALLIVVGIASLMLSVGLSPALGTFLAGVVLANSEFRHELDSNIAPFKGLLLGLFFIAVGAGIDVKVLMERPGDVIGLTLLMMGLKGTVLYVLARMFGLHGRDRWLFTLGLAQAGEFAFVLISFSVGQNVIPASLSQLLLLIVALSMLLTPLAFMVYEALGARARRREGSTRQTEADTIDEQQPIIIAGMGRFGQTVNRLVQSSGFRTVVLDSDLRTIQVVRTFGFKGFYGDPTRPELLHAAGLDKAKVLVVALDDTAKSTALVAFARSQYPKLTIIARARDRIHVFDLYRAGATKIIREVFDSSLRAGRYVLEEMGLSEYEASELEHIFFQMDRSSLRQLAELWQPGVPPEKNTAYVKRSKELNKELENALAAQVEKPRENSSAA